ncbi:MAG TPA: hypothetical protein VEF04_09120, partial [Blastocatellia bacterium]|nr:hypothetical protein [Blastocatellia bacterium]
NDALGHDPGNIPFSIFIDINLPLESKQSFLSITWVKDLIQRIEQRGKLVFGDFPPSFISITNYSWHYQGQMHVTQGECVGIFPPNPPRPLQNMLTNEALLRAITIFGKIPEEG